MELFSIILFMIVVPFAFGQSDDLTQIDSDLNQILVIEDKPVPPHSVAHTFLNISEFFEYALASDEDRPLIKLKHAERRLQEFQKASEDGNIDLATELSDDYIKRIESIRKDLQNQKTDEQVRELKVREKIEQRLNAQNEKISGNAALTRLKANEIKLQEKGVSTTGLQTAIKSLETEMKLKLVEQRDQIRKANTDRLNQVEVDLTDDMRDNVDRVDKLKKEEKIKDIQTIRKSYDAILSAQKTR